MSKLMAGLGALLKALLILNALVREGKRQAGLKQRPSQRGL
jgi:hypothetical protein